MLGEFFLRFEKEVVERKRHGCYERGQAGENEEQGLNSQAYDSCEERKKEWKKKESFFLRGNKSDFLWMICLASCQRALTVIGSLFPLRVQGGVVPLLGDFRLNTLRYVVLEQGTAVFLFGLPNGDH